MSRKPWKISVLRQTARRSANVFIKNMGWGFEKLTQAWIYMTDTGNKCYDILKKERGKSMPDQGTFEDYSDRMNREVKKNPFIGKVELVYNLLLNDILTGKLKPGDSILLDTVAKAMDVSRTPVKDAMLKLMEHGFVDRDGKKGFKVKKVSVDDYVQFAEFRKAFETGSIYFTTRNASNQEIGELRDIVQRMRKCIEQKDEVRKIISLDLEFHYVAVKASKNKYFIRIFEEYRNILHFYQSATLRENNVHNMLKKHEQILHAIEERNEDMAQRYMRSHLSFYNKNISRLF